MFEYFQDEATPPAEIWRASTVIAALEAQLGLTLEPTTAPREIIVIDQVERPAPNLTRPTPMSVISAARR